MFDFGSNLGASSFLEITNPRVNLFHMQEEELGLFRIFTLRLFEPCKYIQHTPCVPGSMNS